jgi:hypothetical protein
MMFYIVLREITIHPQFPQNKNIDKVHIPCFIVQKIHTHTLKLFMEYKISNPKSNLILYTKRVHRN